MLSRLVLVVAFHLVPQTVPGFVALRHLWEPRHLIHDGIHLGLHRLLQIAVDLFPIGIVQHLYQRFHLFRIVFCRGV